MTIHALIVAHGDLARALLAAVEKLAGPQEGVRTLSNEGCDMETLRARIQQASDELGSGPLVVFADLFGGSCANASTALIHDRPDWRLVTGVNVPMLVNFFQNRERLPLDETIDLLVSRGRDGVKRFPETEHGLASRPTG